MHRRTLSISKLAEGLSGTSPFTGPETIERNRGRPFVARLGANESGFGPSPRAIEAMRDAAAASWMYADPDNFELNEAISDLHAVPTENIIVGEGIDGLLGVAMKATLDPGEPVVTSHGAYATFNHHVACHEGHLTKVQYKNDKEDLDALARAARSQSAKIVYVSNPDNPMGTWWSATDIDAFEKSLPNDTLFYLDEAYAETAPESTSPKFDPMNPRIICFRTFSKAYGLAGARIGYAFAHADIIKAMYKVRNQYGINRVGQIGARAAIQDQKYLADAVGNIAQARDRISKIARRNGLEPIASVTNFVAIDCGADGAFAQRVHDELRDRDIFIRVPGAKPLNRCIRVSVGTPLELDIFEAALPDALAAARR